MTTIVRYDVLVENRDGNDQLTRSFSVPDIKTIRQPDTVFVDDRMAVLLLDLETSLAFAGRHLKWRLSIYVCGLYI